MQKMVLLSGPRQSGKTTLAKSLHSSYVYLNYDSAMDRKVLTQEAWDNSKSLLIFDEIHKMKKWKSWLKGIYDTRQNNVSMLATGSARLDVYRKGNDSLAGRYFFHRFHPFTVSELIDQMSAEEVLQRLLTVGGFPEPFTKNDATFSRRWRRNHMDVILRQDLLDLERVREIKSIEILVELLLQRVGSTVSLSPLANELQVSVHTVKHWLQILEDLYVIFPVRPYPRGITRSLLKESKYYFYDSGAVAEASSQPGPVLENVIACALLAELHRKEDQEGYKVSLHYLRDKEKREVDFLTVIGGNPTQMIEVKWEDDHFSRPLLYFQKYFERIKAIQVVRFIAQHRYIEQATMMSASEFLKSPLC